MNRSNTLIKITRIFCITVSLIGFIWFLLPIFMNTYDIGALFGHFLCSYLAFLACFYGKFKKGKIKIIMNILLGLFIAGMIWVIFLSVQIFSGNLKSEIPKNTNLIILGCQVKETGPSLSLQQRLNAGFDYLQENPKALCIVTGGQGANEPTTEALAQKEYLVAKGIDENRIILEDKSENTWENFQFSIDIMKEKGISNEFAVATQEFHMYRACSQAKEQGLTVYPVTARSNPLIFPAHFGRELLAMTKYYIYGFFGLKY